MSVTSSAFEVHCIANFHISLFLIIIIIVNFSAQQYFMKLPIIIQLNNVFDKTEKNENRKEKKKIDRGKTAFFRTATLLECGWVEKKTKSQFKPAIKTD